jgi:hypothetical protein
MIAGPSMAVVAWMTVVTWMAVLSGTRVRVRRREPWLPPRVTQPADGTALSEFDLDIKEEVRVCVVCVCWYSK